MGLGLGFVKDGLQRMAQNRALLKRKDVYKEYVNHGSTKKSIYQFTRNAGSNTHEQASRIGA